MKKMFLALVVSSLASLAMADSEVKELDGYALHLVDAVAQCPAAVSQALKGADGFGRATAQLYIDRGDRYYDQYTLTSFKYHGLSTEPPTKIATVTITRGWKKTSIADAPATAMPTDCKVQRF